MFNFLIGAIDISNSSSSFYDVYATGITMNGLDTPTALIAGTRVNMYTLIACTESTTFPAGVPVYGGQTVANKDLLPAAVCTPANMVTANALVGAGAATLAAGDPTLYKGNANVTAQDVARDMYPELMVFILSTIKV